MKIIVIGARGFPNVMGGIEKHSEELYSRLSNKNNIDIVVLITAKNNKKKWHNIKFVKIPTINKKSLEKILYAFFASCYVITKKPDIVHIQGLNSALYIPLLKIFGLKVVYTQHSTDYNYPKWGKIAKKILLLSEYCSTFANKITVVSPILQDVFVKKYNIKPEIVYNGVNFNSEVNHNMPAIKNFDFLKNEYFLYVGRITPEKDLITLIKAFNMFGDKKKYLVIVGGSEYNNDYNRMIIEQAKKNEKIIFTGAIKNCLLPFFYKKAKLFILPSKFEALPLVPLEAIYFKTEVLLSDIPENLQFHLNAKNYFKAGNKHDLLERITFLSKKPSSQKELELLKKRIITLYNWDNTVEKIYNAYRAL